MKLSRDFKSKKDKEDAIQILKLMTPKEGYRFLTTREQGGYHAQILAPLLGIPAGNKFVAKLANEVYKFVHDGVELPKPNQPKPKPPTIASKPCDGCGGIGD